MVRSLKRYYLELFNASNDFKRFGQKSKNEQFYGLVQQFTQERFADTGLAAEAETTHGVSLDQLTFYVGMMVSTAHIKRHVSTPRRQQDQEEFMGVIYSYSAKKIAKLAKNATFQFLFEEFLRSGEMEQFMTKDKTLGKHPQEFKQTAKNILRLWKH